MWGGAPASRLLSRGRRTPVDAAVPDAASTHKNVPGGSPPLGSEPPTFDRVVRGGYGTNADLGDMRSNPWPPTVEYARLNRY